MWGIETKDLAIARTAAEMARELDETFARGREQPSHADKHAERIGWLRAKLPEILEQFGITDPKDWVVERLIVVDIETMSPLFAESDIPVRSSGTE